MQEVLCLVFQDMGRNAGRQTPPSVVLKSCNTGVKVSYQEYLCLHRVARQGLFYPAHRRLVIGRYLRPYYVPPIPPCRQHKTYHAQAIINHPLDLVYLLLLPCDGNTAPVLAI